MTRRTSSVFFANSAVIFFLSMVLGFTLYSNTLDASFHFDDHLAIQTNPAVQRLWDIRAIWGAFNTRFFLGLTFAVNYAIGGLRVAGYHAVNITVHALGAAMLYELVFRTFQTPKMRADACAPHGRWIAIFAALIFLTHPVQTQAVTYIWQRAATLSALFYLTTLVCYLRWRLAGRLLWLAAAFISMLLGMFTKETAITIPLTLLLCELFFFGGSGSRKFLWALAAFFLALPILPMVFMHSDHVTLGLMRPEMIEPVAHANDAASPRKRSADITRWVSENKMSRKVYYLTQLKVIRTYLRLWIWPAAQNLDYDYPLSKNAHDPPVMLSALLIVAILIVGIVSFWANRLVSFAVFWFFIAIAVECLVVQSDVIFEHRLYLATAAFSIVAAVVFWTILKNRKNYIFLLFAVVLTLSALTFRRNAVWRDEISLWSDVTMKSPGKVRGYDYLATAYHLKGDNERAVSIYQKALLIDPTRLLVYNNLGNTYADMGEHQKAIDTFRKAVGIELEPGHAHDDLGGAYNNMGASLAALGRQHEAIDAFHKAIDAEPGSIGAYNNLGIAYCQVQRYKEAEHCFKKAALLAAVSMPKLSEPYRNLGVMSFGLGKYRLAMAYFHRALVIDPKDTNAWARLTLAERKLGRTQEAAKAESHYRSLASNPKTA